MRRKTVLVRSNGQCFNVADRGQRQQRHRRTQLPSTDIRYTSHQIFPHKNPVLVQTAKHKWSRWSIPFKRLFPHQISLLGKPDKNQRRSQKMTPTERLSDFQFIPSRIPYPRASSTPLEVVGLYKKGISNFSNLRTRLSQRCGPICLLPLTVSIKPIHQNWNTERVTTCPQQQERGWWGILRDSNMIHQLVYRDHPLITMLWSGRQSSSGKRESPELLFTIDAWTTNIFCICSISFWKTLKGKISL